jgi:hypothetical protein
MEEYCLFEILEEKKNILTNRNLLKYSKRNKHKPLASILIVFIVNPYLLATRIVKLKKSS